MEFNAAGLNLIKSFENCKLKVYKDIVGYPTVGYGHRTDVPVGKTITQDEADQLLVDDLKRIEDGVRACLRTELNDNQFSALVSLGFNIGTTSLAHSTLVRLVNSGELIAASKEFEKWDRAGGKEVKGLLRRRAAEKTLFLS